MLLKGGPARRRRPSTGQALVEFALVIPIFLTLVVGIFEFGYMVTIKNELTYSAQDAAQVAAEMGNTSGADFYVLKQLESDLTDPINKPSIVSVKIFQSNAYGGSFGSNTYYRSGSWTGPDGTTIPWGPVGGGGGYPDSARCTVMLGCPGGHSGVDWIGITITYQYHWLTPLPSLVGLGSTAPTIVQTTTTRLEPIQ